MGNTSQKMGRIKNKPGKRNSSNSLKSKEIDEQLKIESEKANKDVKILLLGAGETGKSTIVKQMKILHQNGYTQEERLKFKPIVYNNIIESLATILQAMSDLNISLDNPERNVDSEILFHYVNNAKAKEIFSTELNEAMKRLWLDEGTQRCFMRSNEFQISDSAN